MAAEPKPRLTFDEYLKIESQNDYKSEFINGQMYAMAGASPRHNLIMMNVGGELRAQLKKRPCRVYASDLLLKVQSQEHGRYPDVSVVCGEPIFQKNPHLDALLNPTLLVEVLSSSTEAYDRGIKAEEYRSIPSLREYLLIAQDRCHIEQYVREADNRWVLSDFKSFEDVIQLPSIDCQLALAEVYDKVEWDPTETEESLK